MIPPVDREPYPSSSLASAGYDPGTATFEVEFRHGSIYRYFLVPRSIYRAFLAARSKGRFFVAEIRDRFPAQRVA